MADVDAVLLHGIDRLWAYLRLLRPSACDLEPISRHLPKKPFSHLAAGRIVGAQDKYQFLHVASPLESPMTGLSPRTSS